MNPIADLIAPVLGTVGDIADDLFTSDEERMKQENETRKLENDLLTGQMEVNKVEAANPSVFVAGARPFIIWVGGLALGYQFILYPLLAWGWSWLQATGSVPTTQPPPPVLAADELWVLVSGVLGISGMRSFEKSKGIQTDRLQAKAEKP